MTFGKKEFAALVAEFLGTGALTLLVLSIKYTSLGVGFFVAAIAGIAVATLSLAVAGVSGGYFNPALTLAMWTARKIDTVKGVLYIAVQLLAGFAAFHLFTYLINNDLSSVSSDNHFTWRIMTAEAVATGIFAFAWASAAYKRLNIPVSATVAGLAYMVAIVIASAPGISAQGGLYTGFANPAVALGAKSWVWGTYVLGPVVGGVLGANLYAYLFAGTEDVTAKAVVAAPAVSSKPATKTASKAKKSRAKK